MKRLIADLEEMWLDWEQEYNEIYSDDYYGHQQEKIYDLLDGCALLEYHGNYYEYIGNKNGKCIFQNQDDDSYIEVIEDDLYNREFDIIY